ncbi:MAG: hypothetical protein KGI57_00690 [Hyphomicrobiales bacterium]|nr:hypothetical protein [Hyphomicrobiales bacterium]
MAELSPPRRGSHMREADIVADFEASGALAPPANPKGVLPAPAGAMTLRALLEELDAARGDRDLR